jgi:hypothetical protein
MPLLRLLAELSPGIAAILLSIGGWKLAKYTKDHAHDPRA